MQNKDLILGIDTSNYTTSLAFTDIEGEILTDSRKLLTVKQGERGLRQSHALFQHMENLPEMLLEALKQTDKDRIAAVAASGRPRPVEGSYMPVFKAGVNYGKVMAAGLGVPFFEFSHQEGHLEAVKHQGDFSDVKDYLAFHLSGGTCELLKVSDDSIQVIGGSKDLSFGQVIDRVGVSLGMGFPSGRQMDQIAQAYRERCGNQKPERLKRIPLSGLAINLSGLETQCGRELEKGADPDQIIYELFLHISICLSNLAEKAAAETNCYHILLTGGVSASQFIRAQIKDCFDENPVYFGDPSLSSDNAVGISFLGGNKLWRLNR